MTDISVCNCILWSDNDHLLECVKTEQTIDVLANKYLDFCFFVFSCRRSFSHSQKSSYVLCWTINHLTNNVLCVSSNTRNSVLRKTEAN